MIYVARFFSSSFNTQQEFFREKSYWTVKILFNGFFLVFSSVIESGTRAEAKVIRFQALISLPRPAQNHEYLRDSRSDGKLNRTPYETPIKNEFFLLYSFKNFLTIPSTSCEFLVPISSTRSSLAPSKPLA